MITNSLLDEMSVAAALAFREQQKEATVEELEEIAGVVSSALNDFFKGRIKGP